MFQKIKNLLPNQRIKEIGFDIIKVLCFKIVENNALPVLRKVKYIHPILKMSTRYESVMSKLKVEVNKVYQDL